MRIVFRKVASASVGLSAKEAVAAALAGPRLPSSLGQSQRPARAGVRVHTHTHMTGGGGADRPACLEEKRARWGYWNQPRSDNAVKLRLARKHRGGTSGAVNLLRRSPIASNLGFHSARGKEHYDFALVTARKQRPAGAGLPRRTSDRTEARAGAGARAGFRPASNGRHGVARSRARAVAKVVGTRWQGRSRLRIVWKAAMGGLARTAAALRRVGIDVDGVQAGLPISQRIGAGIQIGSTA